MSNHRNPRRGRQRVRSEISRKPPKVTRSMEQFVASQPAERARKEENRRHEKPTKAERRASEIEIRRRVLGRPRTKRKPRTNYGRTFWTHSHDV